jgi:predicted DNA-binding protein
MMVFVKTISLNLPDELLEASGRFSSELRLTRAEYIRRAIERMNRTTDAELRARRLRKAALKCREADMKVNAEFAAIEGDIED